MPSVSSDTISAAISLPFVIWMSTSMGKGEKVLHFKDVDMLDGVLIPQTTPTCYHVGFVSGVPLDPHAQLHQISRPNKQSLHRLPAGPLSRAPAHGKCSCRVVRCPFMMKLHVLSRTCVWQIPTSCKQPRPHSYILPHSCHTVVIPQFMLMCEPWGEIFCSFK